MPSSTVDTKPNMEENSMKRTITIILMIGILLSMSTCGRGEDKAEPDDSGTPIQGVHLDESAPNPQPQSGRPTEEGWLMSRVDMPVKMLSYVGMDSDGDQLWLSGSCKVDGEYKLVLLGLDTLSSQWQQFNLDRAELGVGEEYDLSAASAYQLSVKDGVA